MLQWIKRSKYLELIRKVSFTLFILAIYKLTTFILLPGVNPKVLLLDEISNSGGLLKFMNILSGGALRHANIMALGIMPYINATIITQLLSSKIGFSDFKALKADRDNGPMQLNQHTKYFTIGIAIISAISFLIIIRNSGNLVYINPYLFYALNIPILVTGSLLSVWTCTQISKYGIGQGISLLIFSNMTGGVLEVIMKLKNLYKINLVSLGSLSTILLFFLGVFLLCIFVEICVRPIAVKCLGIKGESDIQVLNLKINNAGVMTAIMASSFANFPYLILALLKKMKFHVEYIEKVLAYFSPGGQLHYIFFALTIVIFTISQTEIVFDPEDIGTHLQEENIIVLGVRPGERTTKKLATILSYLTLLASLYLVTMCVVTDYIASLLNSKIGVEGVISISGTSILIIVSIAQTVFREFIPYDYKSLMQRYRVR
jgi:preprotein translocase subunit SecY